LPNQDARMDFFNWLYNLEYEVFGIPKPDLNIILHADPAVAQQKVDEKGVRDYVGGAKRDIHETTLITCAKPCRFIVKSPTFSQILI
jgi:dTMP kinase